MLHTGTANLKSSASPLEFLWLELTNQCNLQCVHCYANSSPKADKSSLTTEEYKHIINEAFELGCRQLQLIGGEPTLNPALEPLVKFSALKGYTYIEVFTNLTRLSDQLINIFLENKVRVATSVYADNPKEHDVVTRRSGSFRKTVDNVKKLINAGVPVRAGVIEMEENKGTVEDTVHFLKNLGIHHVGTDRVRGFGRGNGGEETKLTELCGGCAGNILCVGYDGNISPCIMSKDWQIGSVKKTSLSQIVASAQLAGVRNEIYEAVTKPRKIFSSCAPYCGPHCQPTCAPHCSPTCNPISCGPRGCWPAMCTPHE